MTILPISHGQLHFSGWYRRCNIHGWHTSQHICKYYSRSLKNALKFVSPFDFGKDYGCLAPNTLVMRDVSQSNKPIYLGLNSEGVVVVDDVSRDYLHNYTLGNI